MVEEEYGGEEVYTTEEAGGEEEEGEAEAINIPNVVYLEAMLERLSVLEKLARGEISGEEAEKALAAISVPELETRRRRRKKSS